LPRLLTYVWTDKPLGFMPCSSCRVSSVTQLANVRSIAWGHRTVGSIRDQLLMANELIFQLDRAHENRALSTAETQLRCGLKGRVLGLASLDRTIARQRARVLGIREGQADAQFFRS
jgi:hypothetical protein